MARTHSNLSSMGIDALLQLRDDIGRTLSTKAAELKQQLSRLGGGDWGSLRGKRAAKNGSLKGMKLPPKYRDPKEPSLVWAGRGARPRWMQERIKAGAKQEDFLIAGDGKATRSGKKAAKKTGSRRKKKT